MNNSGTVSGGLNGVYITGGTGTVTNSGTITGTSNDGVSLYAGGTITNQSGGRISGSAYGVYLRRRRYGRQPERGDDQRRPRRRLRHSAVTISVTNAGAISGTVAGSNGVYLAAGGTVNNQSGGTISGSRRVSSFEAGLAR